MLIGSLSPNNNEKQWSVEKRWELLYKKGGCFFKGGLSQYLKGGAGSGEVGHFGYFLENKRTPLSEKFFLFLCDSLLRGASIIACRKLFSLKKEKS